jgi:hypothetical protein
VRSGDEETKRLKTWESADQQEEAERLCYKKTQRGDRQRNTHTHTHTHTQRSRRR